METFKCRYCDREFEKPQSMAAHQKWCNPATRPDFSKEKNPMWGKTGRNQWTDVDWDSVQFSELGSDKRRARLLKEAGYACTMCGYDKKRSDGTVVLQIDHIDGNNRNNKHDNLRVLCPNCHATHSTKFMHIGQTHSEETKKRLSEKFKGVKIKERRRISSVS